MTTNTHFNAKVNKGTIEIPVEYQDEIHNAEMVQIVILKPSLTKKHFPQTGIIAELTANPIQIAGFKPLTREEANERWWIRQNALLISIFGFIVITIVF